MQVIFSRINRRKYFIERLMDSPNTFRERPSSPKSETDVLFHFLFLRLKKRFQKTEYCCTIGQYRSSFVEIYNFSTLPKLLSIIRAIGHTYIQKLLLVLKCIVISLFHILCFAIYGKMKFVIVLGTFLILLNNASLIVGV